jgi:CBS-domain-containing membrane protein
MRELSVDKVVVTARHDGARIPVGVVSAADIVTRVVAVGLDSSVLTAGDLVTLPIVDQSGKVTGVLRLDDLLEALARRDSEG